MAYINYAVKNLFIRKHKYNFNSWSNQLTDGIINMSEKNMKDRIFTFFV